jgi:4-hydroxybenzoate polyprenyltransferase
LVVRAFVALPHPGPIALVLAATAGFALIAPGEAPSAGEWAALLGAMLGGQLAIGAVNEVVDAGDDALAKPWKPIPAGLVSRRAALLLAAVGLLAMAIGSATFGLASLGLCALGTTAGFAYDLRLKRSLIPWLPYLVALPLIPIWVWTALDAFEWRLLALYPLGALAAFAVHLAQALPDVAADRAAAIRSPTTLLGERRVLVLCWLMAIGTPLLALFGAWLLDARVQVVALASAAALALVGLDVALTALRPRLGVRACFPCVAVGTAAIGLVWVWALR